MYRVSWYITEVCCGCIKLDHEWCNFIIVMYGLTLCALWRYVQSDVMCGLTLCTVWHYVWFYSFPSFSQCPKRIEFFLTICEQVLIVHVFTVIPPRLSDPCNFITVLDITLSAMLRLDNAPQAKVHADCFIASLWVCLASHTERCIVIVMYHFNRGSVHFILM